MNPQTQCDRPFRLRALFSTEELAALTARSNAVGIAVTAGLWLSIVACFVLLAGFPHPLTFIVAVILLGGRPCACRARSATAGRWT